MIANTTRKLLKLDFLRAVSALIVILFHTGALNVGAGFGVLTFFVISGFLITHLLLRENTDTGGISLSKFYARRSLRIFPAFYVYWLIAVAGMVLRRRILWMQAICSFFYVNNYYQGLHGYPSTLLSHTWSLGVEEQFYLLWPAVFVLFRRSLKQLLVTLTFAIPCIWLYRAAIYLDGVKQAYIYTALETRIDSILAGCLLAVLLHTGVAGSFVAEMRRSRWIPLTLAFLAASVIANTHYGDMYKNVVGFAVDPVIIAVLIAQLTQTKGAMWMDSAPLSYLGRISYSTYLYQQIVLSSLFLRLPSRISVIGCVIATWVMASLSYEFVEKPFLKLKRRFEAVRVQDASGAPVTGEA